ncbi:DUF4249 domain-containing protein [Sphingobacterium oryzagri]|uniref:DUF4249 domain-containing protein n=1 Tax=Sphingobacterium oryzagri TaxID=3025669 RepID=A0ABY7WBL1_9SPHI|nr:DUF4249 domain-containing protein [Sphingobacterium sp. KACC 22765]WDF67039.1 DUF4249 domain-containing protein [Sphingobacterium sp. KACC 22765]
MRLHKICYLPILMLLLFSCEEVIDLQLDSAEPRTVIAGNLNNLSSIQRISVSKTIPVGSQQTTIAVPDAVVIVRSSANQEFRFLHDQDGYYQAAHFEVEPGLHYFLEVVLDDKKYVASSQMPVDVEVDSVGITSDQFFDTRRYYPTFVFQDPPEIENFYLYEIAINQSPLRFAAAYNDKFNNGRRVRHEIADRNDDLQLGDSVRVVRYSIDRAAHKYWSDFESINPGGAAPGNPTSNISGDALGYFSVSPAKEYRFIVTEEIDGR